MYDAGWRFILDGVGLRCQIASRSHARKLWPLVIDLFVDKGFPKP